MQCWKIKAYVQAVRSKDDPKLFTTTISNLAIVISWNNSWNEWRRFLNIRLVSGDNKYKPEIKSVELCERTEKTTENTAVWDLQPRGQEWIRRFPEVLFSPGFCSPEYDVRVVNSCGNHPIHSSSLSCSLGARLSNSFLKTSSDSRFPAYSVKSIPVLCCLTFRRVFRVFNSSNFLVRFEAYYYYSPWSVVTNCM